MSNLSTALNALEAEIAHSKQGLSYYRERVTILEQALTCLALVDRRNQPAPKPSAALKGKGSRKQKSTPAVSAAGNAGRVSDLPSTGGDYWKNLVSAEPQSALEILSASIGQLGFAPTTQQIGKLRNRLTFALNAMVKAGKIQDSGAGRDRRFFKK